jgi:hypothetical protein
MHIQNELLKMNDCKIPVIFTGYNNILKINEFNRRIQHL